MSPPPVCSKHGYVPILCLPLQYAVNMGMYQSYVSPLQYAVNMGMYQSYVSPSSMQ